MESSIRELSGFANLEIERVKAMAENIRLHSKSQKKMLVIIEISNVSALLEELN